MTRRPSRLHLLLALGLLLALTFQSVWASAAPYCRHEVQRPGAASVFHIGHHGHEHQAGARLGAAAALQVQAQAQDGDLHGLDASGSSPATASSATGEPGQGGDTPLSAQTDSDCSSCQGGCAALLLPLPRLPASLPVVDPAAAGSPSLPAPPPALPERPNWG